MSTQHSTLTLPTLREFGTSRFGILKPGWMRVKDMIKWMIVSVNNGIFYYDIHLPLYFSYDAVPDEPQKGSYMVPTWDSKRIDTTFFLDPRLAWLNYAYADQITPPDEHVPDYGLFADFEQFVNEKFPGLIDEVITLDLTIKEEGKPYPRVRHSRLDK